MSTVPVRWARVRDAPRLSSLLIEWLGWEPDSRRIGSIRRAIQNGELLVAESDSTVVGFIHFVMHEDVIDGAPNAFITSFYVQEEFRGRGIGSSLLRQAVLESASRGATSVETSTLHSDAKEFYERRGFEQTRGDIGEVFLELDVGRHLKTQ